jgi:hypothetical protein
MNEHPSPEFEKELRETLGEPHANPAFVRDLRAALIERSTMKQKNRFVPRLAWGLAIAILLALSVVASPRAAALLKQLFGYVPGVGFVEQGESLRLLSAPVTIEKDGLQMTIEQGTADSGRTILLQRIAGYTRPDRSSERFCQEPARLVLPDGTALLEISYGTTWENEDGSTPDQYLGRYEFQALPAGELDAVLEIPCVMYDSAYTDFKLALHFEIADAAQVRPVIELPATSAPPSQPIEATASQVGSSVEGFAIVLESETSLEDGYILTGHYQWTDPRFDGFSAYPFVLQITDANGQDVNLEPVDPITANTDPAIKKLPFAFHILGKEYAFPLTISVQSIIATLPDTATFQFDFGANPQVGQTWNANLDIPIAGHIIHVQTIELTGGRTPTELGFTFTMTSDPQVTSAILTDTNPITNGGAGGGEGGGGGGGGMDSGVFVGPFTNGWAIDGYSPAGIKTFAISSVSLMFKGSWQVTWQPSAP